MQPVAACLIRPQLHYRREAFSGGLNRAGFQVQYHAQGKPRPDALLIIWNRYGSFDFHARAYESAGATVLVAENGYIGSNPAGKFYAISKSQHNGAGKWRVGEEDRVPRLNITLESWRDDGRHILVLPQRGIGPNGVAMPKEWLPDVVARLHAVTDRTVKVRPHPGKERPPLEPDLVNCWAAVTWGSGAALKAIMAGIPVFHEMPKWIGAPAAKFGIHDIEHPFLGDRMPMLRRLAWAQWGLDEIASGAPFRWLIESSSTKLQDIAVPA